MEILHLQTDSESKSINDTILTQSQVEVWDCFWVSWSSEMELMCSAPMDLWERIGNPTMRKHRNYQFIVFLRIGIQPSLLWLFEGEDVSIPADTPVTIQSRRNLTPQWKITSQLVMVIQLWTSPRPNHTHRKDAIQRKGANTRSTSRRPLQIQFHPPPPPDFLNPPQLLRSTPATCSIHPQHFFDPPTSSIHSFHYISSPSISPLSSPLIQFNNFGLSET